VVADGVVTDRPYREAGVVAGVAALALLILDILRLLPSLGYTLLAPGGPEYLSLYGLEFVADVATRAIPFALGVFVVLAFLRPLRDAGTVRDVITRAALASAAGTVLLLVVSAAYAVLRFGDFSGGVFGAAFPTFSIEGSNIAFVFIDAIGSAALAFASVAPVVALAGVLHWLRGSRTAHPPT
jgi:hypothetical protein